jgi:hypothetical protein
MDGTTVLRRTAEPMQRFLDMFDSPPLADFDAENVAKSRLGTLSKIGSAGQWFSDAQRQQQDLLRGLMAVLFQTLGEFAEPGSAAAYAERLAGLVCIKTERRLLCAWEFTELIRRTNHDVCAALLDRLEAADAARGG